MTNRPIVLLVIPHLGGGGAERVFHLLLQNLSPEKYELHLGLVTQTSARSTDIPAHVTVHCLGRQHVRSASLPLLRLVHQTRPDVILSSMAHLNFLVLLLRPLFPPGTRVLVRQNGTVSSMLHDTHRTKLIRSLYRLLYPRADYVICQSQAMADDLTIETGLSIKRIAILHNPIETLPQPLAPLSNHFGSGSGPRLFTAGRLSREKGIDLLLEAIELLLPRFPALQLSIAGCGPEESSLRELSRQLHLDAAVHFLGYRRSLTSHFANADLFVLPSRHEGMPNALLEAAAAGLPLVATPACGGIVNLLEGHPGAWIARDISAPALAQAVSDALATTPLGARVRHTWLQPFRIESAIPAYETLIDSVRPVVSQKRF